MACNHERIKSENCVISCLLCGKVLPLDYLVASKRIQAQNGAKTPEKPAPDVQTGENPPAPVEAAETPAEAPETPVEEQDAPKEEAPRKPARQNGGRRKANK